MASKNNRVRDLGEYRESRAKTLGTVAPALGKMQGEQLVCAQVFAFVAKRLKKRRPVLVRNGMPLAPLLDRGPVRSNVGRHGSQCVPGVKDVVERSHMAHSAPDELSGQVPPNIPVTADRPDRTISPMGRGVTPVKVRSDIAKRLKAARVMARFATQKEAADALGVGIDRYEKWESGRTPVPAQYVGPVCELYGIDANYLFGVAQAQSHRKVAGGS